MKRTNTKSVTEATTKTTPAKTEKVTEKATKTTKRAAAKKSTVKKEVAEAVFMQYAGQEYDINEIKAAVKKSLDRRNRQKRKRYYRNSDLCKTGRSCGLLCSEWRSCRRRK